MAAGVVASESVLGAGHIPLPPLPPLWLSPRLHATRDAEEIHALFGPGSPPSYERQALDALRGQLATLGHDTLSAEDTVSFLETWMEIINTRDGVRSALLGVVRKRGWRAAFLVAVACAELPWAYITQSELHELRLVADSEDGGMEGGRRTRRDRRSPARTRRSLPPKRASSPRKAAAAARAKWRKGMRGGGVSTS